MGKGYLTFYQQNVKQEWKLAFLSAVVFGLLIHTYRFTNSMLNHDALYNVYSSQKMVASGRWFLSIACGFSSYFSLPWMIGVLSVLFLALTTVVVVDIFKAENPVLIVLISGILVSSPAVADTFCFEYTADGYMIAMFLAALSVRLCLFEEKRFWAMVGSGACIRVPLGIKKADTRMGICLRLSKNLSSRPSRRRVEGSSHRKSVQLCHYLHAFSPIVRRFLDSASLRSK